MGRYVDLRLDDMVRYLFFIILGLTCVTRIIIGQGSLEYAIDAVNRVRTDAIDERVRNLEQIQVAAKIAVLESNQQQQLEVQKEIQSNIRWILGVLLGFAGYGVDSTRRTRKIQKTIEDKLP